MKTIRKIFKALLISVASLLGIVIVAGLILMEWPSLAVNAHTLELARRFASRWPDLPRVKWTDARVESTHRGLFANQLNFDLKNLCFEKPDLGHGCVERLAFAFAYGFSKGLPRITEVGPIAMHANEIDLTPASGSPGKREKKRGAFPQSLRIPEFVSDARLEPVQIRIGKWTIASSSLVAEGTSRFELIRSGNGFSLDTENGMDWKDTRGRITIQASSPSSELNFSKMKPISYQFQGTGSSGENSAQMNLHGSLSLDQALHVETEGELKKTSKNGNVLIGGPTAFIEKSPMRLNDCRLDWTGSKNRRGESELSTHCRIEATLARLRPLSKRDQTSPKHLGALFQAVAKIPGSNDTRTPVHGHADIVPLTDFPAGLRFDGKIASDFALMPGESVPREFRTRVDLQSRIPNFQALLRALAATPIAIPAPIRTLRGNAEFNSRGEIDLNRGGTVALSFTTRLNRDPDHLDASGNGEIQVGSLRVLFQKPPEIPRTDAEINLLLSNVRLTLPKTGITTPPTQILPDSRIRAKIPRLPVLAKETKQANRPSALRYLVRVRTPPSHPIRIDSEFTKRPIALGLDLHATEKRPWIGWAEINGNREPVGIPKAQMAGQAGEPRPGPKLPFGFSELLASLLTGVPLQGVSQQPKHEIGIEPTEERRGHSLIELRKRY